MAQTNLNIRMDEELKHQFEVLCADLGLSMTAAFTIFAKAAVRFQGIPFPLALTPTENTEEKIGIREV